MVYILSKPVTTRTVCGDLRELDFEDVLKIKNNDSVANIDNNVLITVQSMCIGYQITAEKLSFPMNRIKTKKSMKNITFGKRETFS